MKLQIGRVTRRTYKIDEKFLMAPTRKSISVNRRYSDYAGVSPGKDAGNSNKCWPKKRKLSDMLGSHWSKEELECFYEAYRKYGKNWKKVAGMVPNRTVEMVEALYNMNRAYLSLPDGIASLTGLIAMMTDHYNVLDESDGDRKSNDASGLSHKPKKRSRGKVQLSGLKEDLLQSKLLASSDGCLSLLKRRHSDGCTVRKRTPRFAVNYSSRKDKSGNHVSPYKRGQKIEVDDDVAHVAALTLTRDLHKGGSPQISKSPYRTDHMNFLPPKSRGKMPEMVRTKLCGAFMDEDCFEGFGAIEGYQKRRKISGKKENIEEVIIDQFDDGWEKCSVTGGGLSVGDVGRKFDIEVANEKFERSFSQGKRKRNKKLFFGDESSALDALQTLADLSLVMPPSEVESESSMRLKEEKPTVDLSDRPTVQQAGSASRQRDKTKVSVTGEKLMNEFSGVDASPSEKSKIWRESGVDFKALPEGKRLAQSANKSLKRKRKSSYFKAFAVEEEKLLNKVKHASHDNSPSTQSKSGRSVENSSSNSETTRAGLDSAVSTELLPTSNDVDLRTKRRNRRKIDPKRLSINKEMKLPEIILKDWPDKYSAPQDGLLYLKDKVSCCLSSYMVRRWCTFEWFYSAIDYPWFAKREFVEYLNHVGLGHIPRLTRVEWGVIRSSLGKPRRFSEIFLNEEREKLGQYRESVRKHYSELHTGIKEGLPTDLAQTLSVGQRVIALHPKSREVYDGSVLTVDHDKCRIQFDRPELGVEFVMDIDCMPLNLVENMPEALRRRNATVDKFSANFREPRSGQSAIGGSMVHAPSEHLEDVWGSSNTLIKQGKEVILTEFVNDDLLKKKNDGDSPLKDSEAFKQQYALVQLQLKEASDQVSSALLNLRERNTYPGNSLPPWFKPPANSSGLVGPINSLDNSSINNPESVSNVVQIVNDSRLQAQTMVHIAVQVMSKLKVGQNAFAMLVEALDSSGKRRSPSDYESSITRSPEQVSGSMAYKQRLNFTSEPLLNGHASAPKLHDSEGIEAQIPSELIVSCVATWLVIQMCTERQFPPADVAQLLDSAVSSLHPRCPQNLPIYREIQMCMGRVKTQILALVPT